MYREDERDSWVKEYRNPIIHTDSKYLIDVHSEHMASFLKTGFRSDGKTRPKNMDLIRRLSTLSRDRDITWVYIKSHSRDKGNDAADILAKAGAMEDNYTYIQVRE
jgi:ribonuclease HI